ncbi:MAG: ABC transporter permease [Tidjanibacter sp.]|nr:ABC transporter permease [Tidjanibacter sp.]
MAKERVEVFLARRISYKKGERSGAMIGIARISVAISVAVMLVAISVIVGFKEALQERLTGLEAHITVEPAGSHYALDAKSLTLDGEFEERVAQMEGFRSIVPYASRAGIIKSGEAMQGALLRGVTADYDTLFYRSCLVEGALPRIGGEERKKDILLPQSLAHQLNVGVGDKVEFVFTSEGAPMRRDAYKVSGIYTSGLASMEQMLTITDMRNVQRLNGWAEDRVSGYMIMAEDMEASRELVGNVRAEAYLAGDSEMWRTSDLVGTYPQLFDWLATHDVNGAVIIIIMIVVAMLNMSTALLIIIFERIRMIGTLKALGMRNGGVQRLFLLCASRVIASGLLWGNVVAGVLLGVQHLTGIITLDPEAYLLSAVPVAFGWGWWLAIDVLLPLVLLALLMVPVAITSRVRPDQTLKYQ